MKQGDRPSAVLIAAWHSGAAELLTTEGARRGVQIELERQPERDAHRERAEATVSDIQNRLMGVGGAAEMLTSNDRPGIRLPEQPHVPAGVGPSLGRFGGDDADHRS
jgi:hypothetical protein